MAMIKIAANKVIDSQHTEKTKREHQMFEEK
jgi:hypothetical protein